MALWTEELERADRCEADEHEEELIDNKIMENHVLHEEPSGDGTWDYMTYSE